MESQNESSAAYTYMLNCVHALKNSHNSSTLEEATSTHRTRRPFAFCKRLFSRTRTNGTLVSVFFPFFCACLLFFFFSGLVATFLLLQNTCVSALARTYTAWISHCAGLERYSVVDYTDKERVERETERELIVNKFPIKRYNETVGLVGGL